MTRRLMMRLVSAVFVLWAVVGILSWYLYDPTDKLVGAKSPGKSVEAAYAFAPRDLQATVERIAGSYLWGLAAEGAKAKPAQEAAEKVVEWRVLAARISGKDRSLLIEIDKKKLEQIKEGEALPDGSRIKDVMPNGYTLEGAEGEQTTTRINF